MPAPGTHAARRVGCAIASAGHPEPSRPLPRRDRARGGTISPPPPNRPAGQARPAREVGGIEGVAEMKRRRTIAAISGALEEEPRGGDIALAQALVAERAHFLRF